jgi:hypothetical protein
MFRVCAIVCVVAACGLAGWAAILAFRPAAQESLDAWEVEEPDRDLGHIPLGTRTLTFRITNRAAIDRRVIGLAEG